MLRTARRLLRALTAPAVHWSLGALTAGGFVLGVMFWGGFNTVLEWSNTERFCVSCHEMRDNVFAELKRTVHYANRSGVRASCPDCHVPHEWWPKIIRKTKASKELWGWALGVVDTPEKFDAHRRVMAEREWARMKANDSLECRNCHQFAFMDLSAQAPRAARFHDEYLRTGQRTCIDCHKGIAHDLPDMSGVPDWQTELNQTDDSGG